MRLKVIDKEFLSMASTKATLEKITALCKRRGFVYQSADIYGGLNGIYDFGPLGVLMKNNIRMTHLLSYVSLKTRAGCYKTHSHHSAAGRQFASRSRLHQTEWS